MGFSYGYRGLSQRLSYGLDFPPLCIFNFKFGFKSAKNPDGNDKLKNVSLTSRCSRFPTMKQETKCKSENIRGEFRAQGLRSQLTILPPTKTAPVVCFLVLSVSLFADNTLADALRLRKMRNIEKKVKRALTRENYVATIKGLKYLSYLNMPKRVSLTQSVALGQARNRHVLLLNELPAPFKKSKAWGFC